MRKSVKLFAMACAVVGANSAWAFTVPSYDPGFWNNSTSTRTSNNCYNYSTNVKTDTFAQPGRAFFGNTNHLQPASTQIQCNVVTLAAAFDGTVGTDGTYSRLEWKGATDPGACPAGGTKLALVIDPGYDYHWYRLDNNGRWSHKPGQTNAKDRDNSNNYINSPETANRGGYTNFCGYFCTASASASQNSGWAQIR